MAVFFLTVLVSSSTWAAPPVAVKRIVVIDKARKILVLFRNGVREAEFAAAFGIDPDSDKQNAADGATPEGLYDITYKKSESRFHRFLGISYPNLANAAKALAQGLVSLDEYKRISRMARNSGQVPCGTALGCGIGIHGGGVFRSFDKVRETDWTEGCVALDNHDMDKVFDFCEPGDPVILFNSRRNLYGMIRPFAGAVDFGKDGVPVCPDGVCTYQADILTSVGRIIMTLKEGKDYGKSLQVTVYKEDAPEKPVCSLLDRNGDGYLWAMDPVSGSIGDEQAPNVMYERIREAVVDSLSRGVIPTGGRCMGAKCPSRRETHGPRVRSKPGRGGP